ncbi:DciA family protein [Streptomyces sp. RK9]|uniref:DciA family protein n=1 Tax=Streptomyces sp. RK9 TaxID=3239284 RepID=UPI003863F8FE
MTIGVPVIERARELPAVGATLREWRVVIAPELAGHIAAVSYLADTGQLTVCPASSAWATKAHLEQTRILAAANESAGRTVVRLLADSGARRGADDRGCRRRSGARAHARRTAGYSGGRLGRLPPLARAPGRRAPMLRRARMECVTGEAGTVAAVPQPSERRSTA